MAKFDLEISGKLKSTTKGNADWYYGGGNEAWVNIAAAKAGVPLSIRNGKTVGVIETNKIVEYIWHNDNLTDAGLVLKTTATTTVVENVLTSTSTTNALSANQGKVLKGLVTANAPVLVYSLVSGVNVGGINVADTFNLGDSLESILKALLTAPLVLPSILSYNTVTLTGSTSLVEVGALQNDVLGSVFTRGLIDNKNAAPNTFLTGASISKVFSGVGINSSTGALNTPAISGNNVWTVTENYALGIDNYYDSLGNVATNLNASRIAGSVTASLTRKGLFPYFYGASILDLSNGVGLYSALTKLLENVGNKNITYNDTNKYFYFVYPAIYGDIQTIGNIKDNNGFDVTNSFVKTVANITSVGLNTNYTQSYNIYRTSSITSINGQYAFNILI